MVKKILVSLILSVVLVTPALARVNSENYGGDLKPTSKDVGEREQENTVEDKKIRAPQESNKDAVRVLTEESRRKLEEKKEALKTSFEQKREEFKNSLEEKRAEVKDKIEAKRTELKAKLTKIKDERKKEIIERVNNRLDEINENRMEHFSNVLEKLDEVMFKIGTRADKAESRGLDVTTVRSALLEAKNAIAISRAAITAQSSKIYSINITSEEALKNNATNARKALHDDVLKVFNTVKLAKEAVHKAATNLAQIPKVDEDPGMPTPTSTQE